MHQSKEGQLGLLFLRVMCSLDALMGSDPERMRHWLEQPNHHLGEQAPRQLLASVEGLARVSAYAGREGDPARENVVSCRD